MTRLLLPLSIFFLLLFVQTNVFSNTIPSQNPTEQRELLLTNDEIDQVKLIKEGRRIRVWTQGDKNPVQGKFSVIDDSTIQIGNRSILVSEITVVRVPLLAGQIIGGVLMIPAAYFLIAGIVLMIQGSTNGTLDDVFLLLAGLAVLLLGSVVTAIAFPLMLLGRKFRRIKKWRVFVK